MGTVFKKTFTKPLPTDAELFEKSGKPFARVKPAKGRAVTYPVTLGRDGTQRIVVEAGTYLAKYRDGSGIVREVSTGCRDESAARCVLNELERRAELVRSGVVSAVEDKIADHAVTPIRDHLADYRNHLEAKGTTERHRDEVIAMAQKLFDECGIQTLGDVAPDKIEAWLNARQRDGMGARNRNGFLQAAKQFAKWAFESSRMTALPIARLKRANEKADRRHRRRPLTETELSRLFYAARWRPLAEAGRETVSDDPNAGKRAGWHYQELRFEDIGAAVERARNRLTSKNPKLLAELDRSGQARELAYRVMALTGLRRGELASLTLKNAWLDVVPPRLSLDAGQTKNRSEAQIVLRSDLAADLRTWIVQLTTEGNTMEGRLFGIPDRRAFLRLFDADLALAGIPKTDDRGRVADVHCLRHSFATSLAKAGVAPKAAQTLLRHSDVNLTLSVYSHSEFDDLTASLDALPKFNAVIPTGMESASLHQLAPLLAPTSGKPCHSMACIGTEPEQSALAVATSTKTKNPENEGDSASFSGSQEIGVTGFEPATPWSQTRCSSQAELHSVPKRRDSSNQFLDRQFVNWFA